MKNGRWSSQRPRQRGIPFPPGLQAKRREGGKSPRARRGRSVFVTFTCFFRSFSRGCFVLLLVSRTCFWSIKRERDKRALQFDAIVVEEKKR